MYTCFQTFLQRATTAPRSKSPKLLRTCRGTVSSSEPSGSTSRAPTLTGRRRTSAQTKSSSQSCSQRRSPLSPPWECTRTRTSGRRSLALTTSALAQEAFRCGGRRTTGSRRSPTLGRSVVGAPLP
eukprot:Amastigsp_a347136_22.p3 type:complete len:126 gc:universal Amastigsp_a347136_22:460-83(-)